MKQTVINTKNKRIIKRKGKKIHKRSKKYKRIRRRVFVKRVLIGGAFAISILGLVFMGCLHGLTWQNTDKNILKLFISENSGMKKNGIEKSEKIEKSERIQGNDFLKQNTTAEILDEYIIDIEGYNQDAIPTGCESVSTTAVLNYLGIEISPYEFIDRFLPIQDFYTIEGVLYGANPEEKFAGNPYDAGSLGCFPPVIADAINRLKESGYAKTENLIVEELETISLEKICRKYITEDIPVLVWTTAYMSEPKQGKTYYLEDDTEYTWKSGEHCMILCGYDENYYYFKDSLSNGETVKYEKKLAEERYYQMGARALIIMKE